MPGINDLVKRRQDPSGTTDSVEIDRELTALMEEADNDPEAYELDPSEAMDILIRTGKVDKTAGKQFLDLEGKQGL